MKIATGLLLCAFTGGAMAAEIRVLSAGAVEPGLRAAAAAFKKQSGHDVNIAFNTAPEILQRREKGLKLVGPLPPEVQNYTSYSAAPMTAAASAELARVFVRYLGSPESKALFVGAGID